MINYNSKGPDSIEAIQKLDNENDLLLCMDDAQWQSVLTRFVAERSLTWLAGGGRSVNVIVMQ